MQEGVVKLEKLSLGICWGLLRKRTGFDYFF
jgi:hypothetical protein